MRHCCQILSSHFDARVNASLSLQTYSSRFSAAQLIIFNGAGLTWDEFVGNLRNGTLYANIYTATAPTGLIRGQLLPLQQKGAHGGVWTSTYGGVWKGYSNHCNVPITWAP
jgi:hypothetical protein